MVSPNWQTNFRDLPTIPEYKRWLGKDSLTIEQITSFKLLNKQPISSEEEKIFTELSTFYSELNEKLTTLDYTTFSETDFENFRNYILYAFNYTALITNQLTMSYCYRLVVNEWVTGKNERIKDIDFIKYPSLEVVRKVNKFNRANTPNSNVFYATENIDTALKEVRPPLNKLVTVGVWKSKVAKVLVSYPISHSETAEQVNERVAKTTKAFEGKGNFNSSLFQNYMRYYFKLLGREFTKQVGHHYEYFISALFSERIFENHQDPNASFRYDCIIYPSVGNGYKADNIAIRPAILDSNFFLEKVIEFEVETEFYDKPYVRAHSEKITLAKIRNGHMTNKFDKEGVILW